MIALSVFKIYAKMLSIGLCWSLEVLPKSGFGGINGERLTLEKK